VKVIDLNKDNIVKIPETEDNLAICKYCIWWETSSHINEVFRIDKATRLKIKLKWLDRVERDFGISGKIMYINGHAVAYSQYAPPRFFPRIRSYSCGPPSKDAIFLACLYIPNPKYRSHRLGSKLLSEIISELRERGYSAIETYARRGSANNPSGPVGFYLRNGFKIIRDDEEFPLLRREF
jgi:GNAT superfamily N-acetyltransferase